jgi:shikimate dehydrogenase
MRKFGLIGYPLGHSFSKSYFADKFITESITDCFYDNYETQDLGSLIYYIRNSPEFIGMNVTIPYKSEIIKYIDKVEDEAAEIGAVNVLKISGEKGSRCIKGYNTDIYGFRESLLPHLHNKEVRNALILGTGGSSKAVAFVLKKLGIKTQYVSSSVKPESISYSDINKEMIQDNLLIINTTPVGMFPAIQDKPEINYNHLTSFHILFDLIYNPEMTCFLREGKERGCTIIGGLRMLQLQADKSWEIWNNKML